MSMNRLWVFGAVLLMGLVLVFGWTLGISPKLSEAGVAKADRASVETQNAAFEIQLGALKKQYENIGDLRAELAAVHLAVPGGADMPAFVGQLDGIAQTHEVTLSTIKVGDAQPYDPLAVAAPLPAEAAPAEGDEPAATATAEPAVAPPVVNDRIDADNFVAVPISLTVDGSYDNVLDFIDGLQTGKRLVMVHKFTTSAAGASESVTATIDAFVYVLLDTSADALVETG